MSLSGMLLGVWWLLELVLGGCEASRNDAFVGYSEVSLLAAGKAHHQLQQHASHFQQLDYLIVYTSLGEIKVELASTAAPEAVSFIQDLVSNGTYDGCSFYRAEPPGDTLDQNNTVPRKGYALVQGGLYSCGKQMEVSLPVETQWKHKKGTVSLITGTSEFFFSLEDHPEWDGSFSVWGKVVDTSSFSVLERIAGLPTYQELHPTGTVMRILEKEVQFTMSLMLSTTYSRR